MIVIGLTGGIGTGKTAVAEMLRDLGAAVISADRVAHEVYRSGSEGWREVVEAFGEGVLSPGGEVDRRRLGDIVFEDEEARRRLNAIVHPRVRSMVEERIRALRGLGEKVTVVEAALLFEAGWADLTDEIWVTAAPEDRVVERVRARDRLDATAVQTRMRSQMSQHERLSRADAVIDNAGSLEVLRERVRVLWHERVTTNKG